ncbi:hypothetical protein GSH05_06550 [Burkholderia pseudomallei]|uniref:hypothetical protein n=1 Tax=Burkholderia pseudomallei TaxID=28450 RepID=UPI001177A8FA|nr:hypothetical protein [Burkholderia pseudomallei]MBM5651329.1 hypothetical protein [Burkholderia pseudomallei]
MAYEQFRDSGRPTFHSALDDIPERAKSLLVRGLQSLAQLDPGKWEALVEMAISASVSSYPVRPEDVRKHLEIDAEQGRWIGNAATFVVTLLGAYSDVTPDAFISEISERGLVDDTNKDAIKNFVAFVAERRQKLEEDAEKATLRAAVLPTLQEFNIAVDIRFDEDPNGKPRLAPIAVTMIDTDSEGQLVWFQMSKRQVESVIQQLQEALAKLEKAEAWSKAHGQS